MYLKFIYIIVFLILLVFASCKMSPNSENRDTSNINNSKLQKESLVKVNKYLVNSESTEIDNYIRRHGLNTIETGSGLKYQIIEAGKGNKALKGRVVTLNYKTKLITGDVIYSSNKSGPMQFEIGHGGVESGLEEAILCMRSGDKAIIIIPSHLAFGLLGDNNSIPPRSTIIYEVEITNIN